MCHPEPHIRTFIGRPGSARRDGDAVTTTARDGRRTSATRFRLRRHNNPSTHIRTHAHTQKPLISASNGAPSLSSGLTNQNYTRTQMFIYKLRTDTYTHTHTRPLANAHTNTTLLRVQPDWSPQNRMRPPLAPRVAIKGQTPFCCCLIHAPHRLCAVDGIIGGSRGWRRQLQPDRYERRCCAGAGVNANARER